MASLLGEAEGQTVGYRTRLDSRVSAATRIEVITEGILTRLLQADPALTGCGLVIFDEFHERSLQADLGLALTVQAQALLRPELRLLVMSATLDGAAVADLLGGAPRVSSAGRSFPVTVRYLPGDGPLEARLVAAIRRALAEETGSLLVFLPGTPEIRRLAAQLDRADLPAEVRVCPLYAGLDAAAQDAAIAAPPAGARKIVLATSIAESSLTIDGIGVVIDAGLSRHTRFNPRTGMDGLVTVPVSRAAAEQRAGRAGRLGPGVCFRLWSEAEHGRLPAYAAPEIAVADLAPLALELALWGVRDPAELAWLTPPPAPHLAQARQLLQALGALDGDHAITPHGRAMAGLGLPPRLAHLLLAGASADACLLAALLAERDILRRTPGQAPAVDIELRLTALRSGRAGGDVDRAAFDAVLQLARRLQSRLPAATGEPQSCGVAAGAGLSGPHRPAPGARQLSPGRRSRRHPGCGRCAGRSRVSGGGGTGRRRRQRPHSPGRRHRAQRHRGRLRAADRDRRGSALRRRQRRRAGAAGAAPGRPGAGGRSVAAAFGRGHCRGTAGGHRPPRRGRPAVERCRPATAGAGGADAPPGTARPAGRTCPTRPCRRDLPTGWGRTCPACGGWTILPTGGCERRCRACSITRRPGVWTPNCPASSPSTAARAPSTTPPTRPCWRCACRTCSASRTRRAWPAGGWRWCCTCCRRPAGRWR